MSLPVGVRSIQVVVPARDEEASLGACLRALAAATAELHRVAPGVEVRTLVVADRCRDATADVARAAGADVLVTDVGSVGAARAAGLRAAMSTGAAQPVGGGRGEGGDGDLGDAGGADLWLATTDADSVVPVDWLVEQVASARDGAHVWIGTVALDATVGDDGARSRWQRRYARGGRHAGGGRHGHVHGASLGVAAAAYLAVGGFAALSRDEDVDLVGRLLRGGHRLVWSTAAVVVTSARLVGRAPGGLSADLADLAGVTDAGTGR